MKSKKDILLILGMHRSGTSALTGSLSHLGYNPGNNLMLPANDNVKGFWESIQITQFNDKLLNLLLTDWSSASDLPKGWENYSYIKEYEDELAGLLSDEYGKFEFPIIKDPRLCLLLPFWKSVLKKISWDAKYIHIIRSPYEVAKSLTKRAEISLNKAFVLWLKYNKASINHTTGSQIFFISYEDLLLDWRSEFKKLKNLRPDILNLIQVNQYKIDQFLDKSLRHHIHDQIKPNKDDKLSSFINKSYQVFLRHVNKNDSCETLDDLINKISEESMHFSELRTELNRDKRYSNILKLNNEQSVKIAELKKINNVLNIENKKHLKRIERLEKIIFPIQVPYTFTRKVFRSINNVLIKLTNRPIYNLKLFAYLIYHNTQLRNIPIHKYKNFMYLKFKYLFAWTNNYKIWLHNRCRINQKRAYDSEYIEYLSNQKASIIIPAYNNWFLTAKCIQSIQNHKHYTQFEIILVDDFSDEKTYQSIDKIFPDVRCIKNAENLGFIESCNIGAKNASHEYLVFLNNDTTVTDNWLDELTLTYRNHRDVGIVGSKLIYPNGDLQEAGGIIWQDGSAWNYGKFDDPSKPDYNYLREVDYVSAASIMISKQIFFKAGGFDAHYKPAYCEDSDLALKVRKMKFSVLYQPLSVVVHHEGMSLGTNLNSGIKSYQALNTKKLYQRWKDTLRKHRANGVLPYLERDRKYDLRIIIFDEITPEPDKDAGSVTAYEYMKSLINLGHRVTFIPNNLCDAGTYTQNLQRIGVECIHTPYYTSVEKYLSDYGSFADMVFLNRVTIADKYFDYVKKYCSNSKIIFNTVDLHYLRQQRQSNIDKSEILKKISESTKKKELSIIRKSDATIILSNAEKELLSKELVDHKNKLVVIPLIMNIPGRKKQFKERDGIVFIGGFRHQPNVDAVLYFVENIWPYMKKKRPNISFTIVGSHPPKEICALECEDIIVKGYVQDVSEIFENTLATIVPLRYGAGIKGKIGHSLSYGVPVVSTSIGVEGMGLLHDNNVITADEPHDFVDQTFKLIDDEEKWNSISLSGLKFARDHYSSISGSKKIEKLIRFLKENE